MLARGGKRTVLWYVRRRNIGNGLGLAGDNIDKGKERGGFRIWGSGVTPA